MITAQQADLIGAQVARAKAGFRHFARDAWPSVCPDPLRWSWHMGAVSEHLQAVWDGQIRYLVICVPPGASKSLLASTLYPAWVWTLDPTHRVLAATYGQDLSDKNARLHRDLCTSQWYRERWPLVEIRDVAQVRHFETTAMGWRQSTSVGGRATGIHADTHIGDDLAKAQDATGRNIVDPQAIEKANDFWFKTMATRRADAATLRRIMIGQRLHHEDTPGKCIDAGWTALVLPMEHDITRVCTTSVVWDNPISRRRERFTDPRTEPGDLLIPHRFPREVVDFDKSSAGLGAQTHEAQNQQNPSPPGGVILNTEKIQRWKDLPAGMRTIITVDCSFKSKTTNDFVALQVWGQHGANFYMLPHRFHGRTGIAGTMEAIARAKDRYPQATVYVEDKANGPAVIELLTGEIPGVTEWSPGTDSKEARAHAVSHLFEGGNVYLPSDALAPWVPNVITTWGRFPLVKHDDDVDATTMALLILYRPKAAGYAAMVQAMKRGRVVS